MTQYNNGEFKGETLNNPNTYRQRELKDYDRKKRGAVDLPMLVLTLIILTIGVIMVLSASYARAYYASGNPTNIFIRQLVFAVSGVALMIAASKMSVGFYRRISMLLLAASIVLLLAVLVAGSRSGGAKRWINLKVTTFQPSEIAKLAVVLSFSHMICVFGEKMKTFKYGVLPFAIVIGIVVGLLVLEPHLSASVIIIAVGAILMFVGGTKLGWFAALGGAAGGLGYLAVTKLGYAADRISAWRDPFEFIKDKGYQTVQSLYAIGSGGLLGMGLGQGRQKHLYLPEEHNDFIFSVVCEELGFIGAMLILTLFALLIIRGYWIALHAKDKFSSLIVTGITSLLALQVFFNVAVVTNLVPCTGISLPFFSYGGTALWLQLIEIGIILSVSRDIPLKASETDDGKDEK